MYVFYSLGNNNKNVKLFIVFVLQIKSCQFCDGSVELRNRSQSKGESSQPNLVNHAKRGEWLDYIPVPEIK